MTKTRITRIGNPTTYNGKPAEIDLNRNGVISLTPKVAGGTEHLLYPDGRMTTFTSSAEEIPVHDEYKAYWRKAFEDAKANVQPNKLQQIVHWVGDKATQFGGWLNRFEAGGVIPQQPSQEQIMQQLMQLVQQAAGEIQSKKPSQAVQQLAQIAQDPQGAEMLDMLTQEVPEVGQIVEAVMNMIGAFKCGGKTKKKVKKGAKGCVPCKKLMKVGGRLTNVLVDCEGNIIKYSEGGRFIPKGYIGLNTENLVSKDYRTHKQGIAGTDTTHYYIDDHGNLRQQGVTKGNWNSTSTIIDLNDEG
jgi:hypothetical protein